MAVDKYQGHFIRPKYFHTPFFYFFPPKIFWLIHSDWVHLQYWGTILKMS